MSTHSCGRSSFQADSKEPRSSYHQLPGEERQKKKRDNSYLLQQYVIGPLSIIRNIRPTTLGKCPRNAEESMQAFPPKERRQIEQAYIQVAIKGAMFSASLQVKIKVIWQFQAGPLSTSAKDRYSSHENPATKAASTSFSISRLSLSLFSSGTMLSMGRSTVFTLFFFFAPPFFSSPFSPTWGKTTKSQISLGRRTGLKLALENA